MRALDHRDICIDDLADAEALLLDRLADLTAERDAYRLLAQQAIHLLNDRHNELLRLRASNRLLAEECRTLRAATRAAA